MLLRDVRLGLPSHLGERGECAPKVVFRPLIFGAVVPFLRRIHRAEEGFGHGEHCSENFGEDSGLARNQYGPSNAWFFLTIQVAGLFTQQGRRDSWATASRRNRGFAGA
jgi:hypothetical protein